MLSNVFRPNRPSTPLLELSGSRRISESHRRTVVLRRATALHRQIDLYFLAHESCSTSTILGTRLRASTKDLRASVRTLTKVCVAYTGTTVTSALSCNSQKTVATAEPTSR